MIVKLSEESDADSCLEKADQIILNLRRNYRTNKIITPKDRGELLSKRYDNLNNPNTSTLLPTGFIDIDRVIGGGFAEGELVIVAGDSGIGKSVFAQNLAVNQAIYGNVLFSCF